MKSRSGIFALAAVAVVVALLLLLRPRHIDEQNAEVKEAASPTNTVSAPSPVADESSPVTTNEIIARTSPWAAAKNEPQKREEMFKTMVHAKNYPIAFYGKVLDQNRNPLAGVKVLVKVRQWYVAMPGAGGDEGKMIPVERETSQDGLIEIQGLVGDGLDVEYVQKDGYVLSPKAPRHYGPSSGSMENPVIIVMWKKGPTQPLVTGHKVFGIIPDGRVYTVDFLHGKKIEGMKEEGDLRLAIMRQGEGKPRSKYHWSFSVEAVGGGILQTDDEFMYLAPETGYVPRISMAFEPSATNWTSLVGMDCFVMSRSGQVYGRLNVRVHASYNEKSAFEFDYAVNPSGSRSLEPK